MELEAKIHPDYKIYFQINKNLIEETKSSIPTEILDIARIPFVNRCVRVFCDLKASNFCALQYHPNTLMRMYPLEMKSNLKTDMKLFLDETLLNREFYDIELKFRDRIFYIHKYILLSRCPKLFNKQELIQKNRIDLDQVISPKFPNNTIEIIINFIYTNECSKEIIKRCLKSSKIFNEATFIKFINDFKETFIDKFGFVEFKSSFDQSNFSKVLKEIRVNSKDSNDEKLEILSEFMFKMLDFKIFKSNIKRKPFKYTRESYQEFYDCKISLNNNQMIECHKCILIARSEFFRNMLLGCWLESNSAVINLPFDLDLMQIFIDYLYTDEILMDFIHAGANYNSSLKSKSEKEIEVLFNLYVLSDQLLMDRLKNLCEFKLANLVSLKNVGEIFEFSDEYQAKQLKDFCMEFMTLNLVTLIESKKMENINPNRLSDFSDFYKLYFNLVGSRRITPYSDGLEPEKIELIPVELIFDQNFVDGNLNDVEESWLKQKKNSINRMEDKKEIEIIEFSTEPIEEKEIECELVKDNLEENLKWEKVKKKKSRKISSTKEAETPKIPVGLNSISKASQQVLNTNEKELKKIKDEKNRIETQKQKENEEWPSLFNPVETKIQKEVKLPKTKPIKESKLTPFILNTPKSPNDSKLKEEIKVERPVWGSNPTPSSSTSSYKLMDIINEEMKRVNLNKKEFITPVSVKPQVEQKPEQNFKVWNLDQNNATEKASISQIMEMEKKSKEHYNKIKNRPLNTIQLEEKAIQDLKNLYEVDLITDMTITIELIDEVDLKGCLAPIWKKN